MTARIIEQGDATTAAMPAFLWLAVPGTTRHAYPPHPPYTALCGAPWDFRACVPQDEPWCGVCVERTRAETAPDPCFVCDHADHGEDFCAALVDAGEGRDRICGCAE